MSKKKTDMDKKIGLKKDYSLCNRIRYITQKNRFAEILPPPKLKINIATKKDKEIIYKTDFEIIDKETLIEEGKKPIRFKFEK